MEGCACGTALERGYSIEVAGAGTGVDSQQRLDVGPQADGKVHVNGKVHVKGRIMSCAQEQLVIKGHVVSGLREGQFLTQLDWVSSQCVSKLGFLPVPGTLNVRVVPDDLPLVDRLNSYRGVKILPPTPVFAIAKCFVARIRARDAVLMRPMLDDYPRDVLELIAPVNLRAALNLADGEAVEVCVHVRTGERQADGEQSS